MLPTDPRLSGISPFQEMWMMAQVNKRKQADEMRVFDQVKLICSFIDPARAKQVFSDGEKVESDGFFDDMKAMDPNFDQSAYEEILENM